MTMAEAGEDSDTGIKAAPASNSRPPGAELSAEEEAATRKFLENVNKWRTARQLGEERQDTRYNKRLNEDSCIIRAQALIQYLPCSS